MCGRLNQYARIPTFWAAGLALKIKRHLAKAREDKRGRVYILNNICPTDYADVVIQDREGFATERMRFGLIPNWARGSRTEVSKKFARTFNARSDTIFELGSYRQAIRERRCVIPARGWHEWPDRTTPYYIHRSDDQPLWLAGIGEGGAGHAHAGFPQRPRRSLPLSAHRCLILPLPFLSGSNGSVSRGLLRRPCVGPYAVGALVWRKPSDRQPPARSIRYRSRVGGMTASLIAPAFGTVAPHRGETKTRSKYDAENTQ